MEFVHLLFFVIASIIILTIIAWAWRQFRTPKKKLTTRNINENNSNYYKKQLEKLAITKEDFVIITE